MAGKGVFKCTPCNRVFETERSLLGHMSRVHGGKIGTGEPSRQHTGQSVDPETVTKETPIDVIDGLRGLLQKLSEREAVLHKKIEEMKMYEAELDRLTREKDILSEAINRAEGRRSEVGENIWRSEVGENIFQNTENTE